MALELAKLACGDQSPAISVYLGRGGGGGAGVDRLAAPSATRLKGEGLEVDRHGQPWTSPENSEGQGRPVRELDDGPLFFRKACPETESEGAGRSCAWAVGNENEAGRRGSGRGTCSGSGSCTSSGLRLRVLLRRRPHRGRGS